MQIGAAWNPSRSRVWIPNESAADGGKGLPPYGNWVVHRYHARWAGCPPIPCTGVGRHSHADIRGRALAPMPGPAGGKGLPPYGDWVVPGPMHGGLVVHRYHARWFGCPPIPCTVGWLSTDPMYGRRSAFPCRRSGSGSGTDAGAGRRQGIAALRQLGGPRSHARWFGCPPIPCTVAWLSPIPCTGVGRHSHADVRGRGLAPMLAPAGGKGLPPYGSWVVPGRWNIRAHPGPRRSHATRRGDAAGPSPYNREHEA
jgi:hypothetical protein